MVGLCFCYEIVAYSVIFIFRKAFKKGLLVLSTHNITLAHTPKVIREIGSIYDYVFKKLNHVIRSGTLRSELEVEPLTPLFKVR